MSLSLDTNKLPKRISKKFYSMLTDDEKILVDKYRQEKAVLSHRNAVLEYQKRHAEKVNEYQKQIYNTKREERFNRIKQECFLVKQN
jgi:TRAP-type C4-dicarboxylate transport system substrate-binding protein